MHLTLDIDLLPKAPNFAEVHLTWGLDLFAEGAKLCRSEYKLEF